MFRSVFPLLMSLALAVSGCQIMRPSLQPLPTPRATATLPRRTPTPTSASPPVVLARSPITLTVWLPDTLVPPGNTQSSTILTQQIAAFAATQADVRVQALVKRAHGSGGLLDLVQATAPVAPSVLPDVVLLDLSEVSAAAQSGLLRPLNDLVPASALTDLFPFAEAGLSDSQWVAIAYTADLEHLAYNAARVQAPPLTWAQVLSGSQQYLFPAGASGGMPADALFAQYAAFGGQWQDATGQPLLDAMALTQMLDQFKDAQQAGVISTNVLNFSSPDNTWMVYLSSATPVVDVRASRFVSERTMIYGTMAAPLPGRVEPARLIARGWALVVPTRDPDHLPLAASLVAWLVSPENEGAWTRAASLLPAHRKAFDHWFPADSYTAFVRQELERAIPAPPAYVAQVVSPALQKAVADVLRGQAQPADAAAAAVASVGRGPK